MDVGKKILIADDEPNTVWMLAMRLKAQGYQVISAFDGIQAVSFAHRQAPDLIILDIKMPAKDGYSVVETLKISRHTDSIPILFLSALPPAEVQEKAIELGVEGFIPKPFDPDEVLAEIDYFLGE